MKKLLLKIVEVILPFEIEKKLLVEINQDTYRIIINLPYFSKIACIFFLFLSNYLSFNKYFVPFYFCSKNERSNLINKNYIFRAFKGNLLKLVTTYTSLVFYDNPEIQKKIGYSHNDSK